MDTRRTSADKSKKLYTFNVSFSFDMQFTFTDSEVRTAEEGEEDDIEPKDEALAALEKEIEKYLSKEYPVSKIEAFADFDSFLGVTEE